MTGTAMPFFADTMVAHDCSNPFGSSTVTLTTADATAGQPVTVQLNSTISFAAMQCMSSGWNTSLQGPASAANFMPQTMNPWNQEGSIFVWNTTIAGVALTTVSIDIGGVCPGSCPHVSCTTSMSIRS
jgi:hypothetical protein